MSRRRRCRDFETSSPRCTHPAHSDLVQRAFNELSPVHGIEAAMLVLECGCLLEAFRLPELDTPG